MAGSTRYSYPTLPLRGKFAKIFPQNHGNGRFAATARRRIMAAKKPRLAARKNHGTGLPSVRRKTIACSLCCDGARFG
jgi:hypothetical protein